jgi:hypothetical protein
MKRGRSTEKKSALKAPHSECSKDFSKFGRKEDMLIEEVSHVLVRVEQHSPP